MTRASEGQHAYYLPEHRDPRHFHLQRATRIVIGGILWKFYQSSLADRMDLDELCECLEKVHRLELVPMRGESGSAGRNEFVSFVTYWDEDEGDPQIVVSKFVAWLAEGLPDDVILDLVCALANHELVRPKAAMLLLDATNAHIRADGYELVRKGRRGGNHILGWREVPSLSKEEAMGVVAALGVLPKGRDDICPDWRFFSDICEFCGVDVQHVEAQGVWNDYARLLLFLTTSRASDVSTVIREAADRLPAGGAKVDGRRLNDVLARVGFVAEFCAEERLANVPAVSHVSRVFDSLRDPATYDGISLSDRQRWLLRMLVNEADRAYSGACYLTAAILAGAILENVFCSIVLNYSRFLSLPMVPKGKPAADEILGYSLGRLIQVLSEQSRPVLLAPTVKMAEAVRDVRNLFHAGKSDSEAGRYNHEQLWNDAEYIDSTLDNVRQVVAFTAKEVRGRNWTT